MHRSSQLSRPGHLCATGPAMPRPPAPVPSRCGRRRSGPCLSRRRRTSTLLVEPGELHIEALESHTCSDCAAASPGAELSAEHA
jgi:hypothetical protein